MTLDQLGLEESTEYFKDENIHYSFAIRKCTLGSDNRKSLSILYGTKLIEGVTKEKTGIGPYEEERRFAKFIINTDENDTPIEATCEPDQYKEKLGPLTFVFFKREVLNKYYNNPKKYSVEDGRVRCCGFWGLGVDNNHSDYVVVHLRDLSLIPYEEQLYWKSFNIPPAGWISDSHHKRAFLAEFADPDQSDFLFRFKFDEFLRNWQKCYDWALFKPLGKDDKYLYGSLRIPLTNSQKEFDEQVLTLSKILVDSLNEEKFKESIPEKVKGAPSRLAAFFEKQGLKDYEQHIIFLRKLLGLRSGAGHKKGDKYRKAAEFFNMKGKDLKDVFDEILGKAVDFIEYLDRFFLHS